MIILYQSMDSLTLIKQMLEKDEIDNMNQHIFWVTD